MTSDISIRPFRGTVTVRFLDVVMASTDAAKIVNHDGVEDQVFIPFDDIYFEFLTRSQSQETCKVKGPATIWSIQAQGRSESDAMRSYGENEASRPLARHGLFDSRKVTVEMAGDDLPVA